MKRELDFKLEQLNERRAELKQDQELVKAEKIEISRQKDQLKVSAITSQTVRHFMFNTEGSFFHPVGVKTGPAVPPTGKSSRFDLNGYDFMGFLQTHQDYVLIGQK